MTGPLLLAGILLAAAPAAATDHAPKKVPKAAPERWDASIYKMKGDVEMRLAGEKEWVEPKKRTPLFEGDSLRVGSKGSADIAYGRQAITHLRPGTHLVIERLDTQDTSLRLESGTLLTKLKSLKARAKGLLRHRGHWAVRTPTANCAVRGTEFGVMVDEEGGGTTAGVFDEGEVALIPREETAKGKVYKGEELKLEPNQEAEVAGGKLSEIRPLTDLLAYRKYMRQLRRRLAAIQRRYRTLPIRKRRELRRRLRKERE